MGYKEAIQIVFQYQVGELPVKYLGLPLITTRLSATDCKPLLDSILNRIKGWTVKHLSFAGRLQLIKSVLNSLHVYWSSLLILPKKIINRVEQVMRDFLWKGQNQQQGSSKVAWKEVTSPLKEGGLGIKKLSEWNKAAMAKHIWNIWNHSTTSSWADGSKPSS